MQAVIRDQTGQPVGLIALEPVKFKTGNDGYRGQEKLVIGGTRYQAQVIIAKIRKNGKK